MYINLNLLFIFNASLSDLYQRYYELISNPSILNTFCMGKLRDL